MKVVSIDDLAETIMDELNEYNTLAASEMEEIAKEVAEEGAQKLKQISPRGKGSRKGHYADGWTVMAERTGIKKFRFTVHNSKKPGLTHLLENGHQLRQGGRAKAIPHIKQIEEWCNNEYVKRVQERMRR